jgi:hypothetical protein
MVFYSFRPGRLKCRSNSSCETQLLTLSHELLNNLHTGKQTDLIILDFSKAFDNFRQGPPQETVKESRQLRHQGKHLELDLCFP